jgi:outer membrane protein assembly factor BamA
MGGIQGVTFLDFGSTWYDNKFHPFKNDYYRGFMMDDLVAGYGMGARIYLGVFVLKIDVAWRFDFDRTYSPRWYFCLDTDF